ncbi:isoprenyl transferase [Hornefia butyriciproducens]|uniref:isoprenyl transferase n=1 Tax=Hornefia butyriciproducens TaxID=2652293 RepID=UPI002A91B4AE|nr:isoprenyl transferase [Hornefia butyriciproducens]MCI7412408.1 isoprenyl transferase [Clostridiales bacterium]MDY6212213.1 isoprenyl transferase [Hornefia butyriciproducens]
MLDLDRMPTHVAVIMDGNGRWAKRNNVSRLSGHNAGMNAMKEIVRRASDLGIRYLTVYAFSTENWKRSEEEVSGIFRLLVKFVRLDLAELDEKNVRVRALGDYSIIPAAAKKSLEDTLETTKDNTGMQFNIALNYGSRNEITRAVNSIVQDVREGRLQGEVTEEMISRRLYTGEECGNVPDPDLIIRTSGEERLSNFLLWQSAYSEFIFTDTLWPDFTPEEFETLIERYQSRDRRFGGRK